MFDLQAIFAPYVPEAMLPYLGLAIFAVAVMSAVIITVFAFHSYKLMKLEVAALTATVFGAAGYIGGIFISDALAITLPIVTIEGIIALVCAVGGLFLGIYVRKLVYFLYGAAIGVSAAWFAVSALQFQIVEFMTPDAAFIIAAIVLAIIFGILSVLLFKFFYLLGATVFSLAMFGALIGFGMAPNNIILAAVFAVVGIVVGIIALVKQYKAPAL